MRNPFFDILKFLAIMLVVYRHVSKMFGNSFGQPLVDNFIVGMNMPLFFMISGYFSARTIKNGDWRKLCKHIYGYFWPVAAVSIVFAAFAVVFNLEGSEGGFIGYAGRRFLFSPWFLWCLSYCFIATFICCLPKSAVLRGLTCLFLIIVLPCFTNVWYMDDFRSMLPFFAFGVIVLRRFEIWKSWRFGAACLVVYMLVALFQGDIGTNGLSFYGKTTTWVAFAHNGRAFLMYIARIFCGVAGSVGVMWVLSVVCDKYRVIKRLAPLGTTTLWVYILHQWLLERVVDVGWYDVTLVCTLFWTLLLFCLTHFIGLGVHYSIGKGKILCFGAGVK